MTHLSDGPGTVKGIGPKKQRLLEGMGIHTLRDVLQLYPFRYGMPWLSQPGVYGAWKPAIFL